MNADRKSFSSWEDAVAWLRTQADQANLVVDSYYDDPLSNAAERYHHSTEWRAVSELLSRRSGSALDVGAGRGIASYALARDGFEVTSLEPDPSDSVGAGAIRSLASSTGLPIRVVEQFSEALPFSDNSFDVVFARAVLHHMCDLGVGCRELARVLKPGGLFLAVREHVISRPEDLPVFLASHPLHHIYGGENAYMLSQYRAALQSAGFRIVKELRPLTSPINYSPRTRESLRREFADRLRAVPAAGRLLDHLLRSEALLSLALKLVTVIDRRPGRLYSFVCEKTS